MLAGATGLDLALLVVAADDSVMPQTREHLEILRLLGLSGGRRRADQVRPGRPRLARPGRGRRPRAGRRARSSTARRSSGPRPTTGLGIDELTGALRESLPTRPRPRRPRALPDGDRPGVHGRRARHGGHGHGGLGVGRRRRRAGMAPRGPAGARPRPPAARPARRARRPGRAGRRSTSSASITPRSAAARSWPRPAISSRRRVLSVEVAAAADAPRPLRHRGRYRLHIGTAEVAATLALLERERLDRATGGWRSSSWPSRSPRSTASRSSSARRARRRRSAAAGCSSPTARAIRRRDRPAIERLGAAPARPTRRADSRPRSPFLGLKPWTDRDLCRTAGRRRSREVAGRPWTALAGVGRAASSCPSARGGRPGYSAEVAADLEDRVLCGPRPAPRGPPPAIDDPPRAPRARPARPRERGADRRRSSSASRPRAGRRPTPASVALRGPRAEAQPGGAEAQGRSSPRRSAPAASARPTSPNSPPRPAPAPRSSPNCWPCSATRSSIVEIGPGSTSTSTPRPSSAHGSPAAGRRLAR